MNHARRPHSTRLLSSVLTIVLAVGIGPAPALAAAIDDPAPSTVTQAIPATAEDATQAVNAIGESLSVEGDVTVSDNAYAAKVQGQGAGNKGALDVGGSVTNTTKSDKTIFSLVTYGFDGGEGQANVGRDVSAGSVESPAEFKKACAVFSNADSGALSVEILGDVSAACGDDATGIWVDANDSAVEEKVEGDVSAVSISEGEGPYDAFGVNAQADNSSNASVEIGGDLSAKAEGPGYVTGCGAYLYSSNGSANTLDVRGNIDATSSLVGAGAKLSANANGKASLKVDGDIAVAGACAEEGAGVWLEAESGGYVELVAKGTIHGKTSGLLFDGGAGEGDDEGDGDGAAGQTGAPEADAVFDITAWKIEVDEGGSLFAKGDYSANVPDDVSSQVNYIVKVEQPLVGGTISAVSEQKTALEKKSGLDVAHAGDKVYLQADLEPGYYLNAAYNGKGQRVPLSHDEGGYYVVVPEGGGVYITADLTQSAEPAKGMSIANGMAQHVFAYSDVHADGYTNANSELYRFVVYVETDNDTDRDGKCDLVKTYVQVPRAAVEGEYLAPAIFMADPYSAGMRASDNLFKFENDSVDIADLLAEDAPVHRTPSSSITSENLALSPKLTKFSEWNYELDGRTYPSGIQSLDYYLVRGFAIVQAAGLGTYGSEGIECCGTAMERDAFASIVEWLHGNEGRKAYADAAGTLEVKASDWSSGHVGMTGLSYPGAMCYEVATSGVEGLDTVVPVAGPSSWYDDSNSQGISVFSSGSYNYTTVLADTCASRLFPEGGDQGLLTLYQQYRTYMNNAQTELQGDYGPYWAARDWYTGQTGIKASALIVTGFNDKNVSTKHFDLMRDAFLASGCEVKTLLHQNAHIIPANEVNESDIMIKNHTYREWLNLWFTRALLGVDNEASTLADFTVQSNIDGSFYDSDKWNGDDTIAVRPGGKGETTVSARGALMEVETLVQDVFDGSTSENAACWTYSVSAPFTIAGKIPVHLRAKVDDVREGDIMMSAVLVDAADEPFPAFAVEGDIENEVIAKGGENPLSYDLVKWKQNQTTKKIVSTGAIDLRNPEAAYEPASATRRADPIAADTYYDYTLYLDPTYYTVQKGHRLELYIVPFLDYLQFESEEGRDYILGKMGLDASSLMNIRTDYAFTIDDADSFASLPVTAKPQPAADPEPADIADATVAKVSAKTYTGKAIKPKPAVTYKGKKLANGVDYTLSYKGNVKAGTAVIVIKGKGNFKGQKTLKFSIKRANVKAAKAKKLKARTYTGKKIRPKPRLSYKGKKLKKGRDYKLTYKGNKKRGTAKIVVKGKGNFKGKKVLRFKIR